MQAITHAVTHYYQPTANSCGYTALAILLSYYGVVMKPEAVLAAVPQPLDEAGQPTGSITAQLVAWLARQGHDIDFYSFDCQILDLAWQKLDKAALLTKLAWVKDVRSVGGLGAQFWSRRYVDAYIDMLEAGCTLHIQPHVTSQLLYELLGRGPVYANICANVVNNKGRTRQPKLTERRSVSDDVRGKVSTHSIVIYGVNATGDFLVADPWKGRRVVGCETMLCGITAAQIECDNQCFQIVA